MLSRTTYTRCSPSTGQVNAMSGYLASLPRPSDTALASRAAHGAFCALRTRPRNGTTGHHDSPGLSARWAHSSTQAQTLLTTTSAGLDMSSEHDTSRRPWNLQSPWRSQNPLTSQELPGATRDVPGALEQFLRSLISHVCTQILSLGSRLPGQYGGGLVVTMVSVMSHARLTVLTCNAPVG